MNISVNFKNLSQAKLIEKSVQNHEGHLGPHGELIIQTGKQTGRSADDKYVVKNEVSDKKIWWENNIREMSQEVFDQLTNDVLAYYKTQSEVFSSERSIGHDGDFSLGIKFFSPKASAAFFSGNMFKEYTGKHNDEYTILHAPGFFVDKEKYKTRSEVVLVTCFLRKITIIAGTHYAGEIKKSMFSIMNFLTPDRGILPMHSGANQNNNGESFVFFGLSGTGKTTLSTDEGLLLIGDDEHGLSDKGLFNFEGGCYAKTAGLSEKTEPGIFKASTQFGSMLENVKLSEDQATVDFFDISITENGRSSYPLSFINERVKNGTGSIPKNIFYLSADAFGVLPPVSLLTSKQALDYFKLGYSAKLAGTEIGIKTPVATFSTCFGAPFMIRHPKVYSELLKRFIEQYDIRVWLINTGWYGGSYGEGKRFPLAITRQIIREIQYHNLDQATFVKEEFFDLKIPTAINGVDSSLLNPASVWKDSAAYTKTAKSLSESFEKNLIKLQ